MQGFSYYLFSSLFFFITQVLFLYFFMKKPLENCLQNSFVLFFIYCFLQLLIAYFFYKESFEKCFHIMFINFSIFSIFFFIYQIIVVVKIKPKKEI